MKWSRWAQVTIVPNETAETLIRTLADHFVAFGGVPLCAVFDRPTTVALQWKKNGEVTEWRYSMPVALTWNLTDADRPRPWTLDVKVEIFRERVDGWQLWIAQLVANGGDDRHGRHHEKIPHAGFAVLLIVMSYFEMIARYLEGDLIEAKAGEFSKKGFRAVAGSLNQAPDRAPVDQLLADWYKQVRCGLYHTARVRRGLASPEKSATSSSTTARVAPCSSIHTFSRMNYGPNARIDPCRSRQENRPNIHSAIRVIPRADHVVRQAIPACRTA